MLEVGLPEDFHFSKSKNDKFVKPSISNLRIASLFLPGSAITISGFFLSKRQVAIYS
jgi:hypothetical protein